MVICSNRRQGIFFNAHSKWRGSIRPKQVIAPSVCVTHLSNLFREDKSRMGGTSNKIIRAKWLRPHYPWQILSLSHPLVSLLSLRRGIAAKGDTLTNIMCPSQPVWSVTLGLHNTSKLKRIYNRGIYMITFVFKVRWTLVIGCIVRNIL